MERAKLEKRVCLPVQTGFKLKSVFRSEWKNNIRVALITLNNTKIQYLFGDVAIFVDVVKVEGPVQFFCHGASQEHRKSDHEILNQNRKEF